MNQESITRDATSFGDLPAEVHGMIASLLDPYDLSLCVLVSKSWRAIFHRYLWRHVAIRVEDSEDFDLQLVNLLNANREHIHSLKLSADYGDVLHSFMELLSPSSYPRPVFPILDSAEIEAGGFDESTDETMAQFLELTGAKWKRLVLKETEKSEYGLDFGSESMEVLARHTEFLEVFRWMSDTGSTDGLVEQLLCSAPKLKELSVVGHYNSTGGYLDAREIVKMEWVCSGLEVFECRIRRIPRPDITRNIGDSPANEYVVEGTLEESLDLQRQVYTKLAMLTKLQVLKLGLVIDFYNTSEYELGDKTYRRQFDCLAMTLDSGLDLLKGLKELRLVGLEDMEVYIGEKEQSWFKEHWPNAKIELGEDFHDEYLE
ncbi:hypothetical protein BGZ91_002073 [Linnemannia elongata]|nr:hypothetical protein BGZ91_002073 [Linnemannia elongata]KAG0068029.1 hypothetical protein BGZ90_000746 [Linnemannia elongata]